MKNCIFPFCNRWVLARTFGHRKSLLGRQFALWRLDTARHRQDHPGTLLCLGAAVVVALVAAAHARMRRRSSTSSRQQQSPQAHDGTTSPLVFFSNKQQNSWIHIRVGQHTAKIAGFVWENGRSCVNATAQVSLLYSFCFCAFPLLSLTHVLFVFSLRSVCSFPKSQNGSALSQEATLARMFGARGVPVAGESEGTREDRREEVRETAKSKKKSFPAERGSSQKGSSQPLATEHSLRWYWLGGKDARQTTCRTSKTYTNSHILLDTMEKPSRCNKLGSHGTPSPIVSFPNKSNKRIRFTFVGWGKNKG